MNLPALATLLALSAFLFVGCDEIQENYFPSLPEARRAGMLQKGWIPSFLPETSTNIYELHDLDSNHGIIRFELSEKDLESYESSIKEKRLPEGQVPEAWLQIKRKWWPLELRAPLQADHLSSSGYRLMGLTLQRGNLQQKFGCAITTNNVIFLWY